MQYTFHVGQLVRLKEPPRSQGDGRAYCIIGILPSETEGTPTYIIKNVVGAQRIVRQQEIKAASAQSLP